MTVRDLIKRSLKLIGLLAEGETPSGEMLADSLDTLNEMISSWNNQGLMVFKRSGTSFPLTPSQKSYTIGIGGDFNTDIPQEIYSAGIEIAGSSPTKEYPVQILTSQEYADIAVKDFASTLPTKIHLVRGYPLSTIYVWPVPLAALNIVLYQAKAISQFVNASDVIVMPDGYSRAMRYNLAVELAPEFGKVTDPKIDNTATESKAEIMRRNIEAVYLVPDAAGVANSKLFNIITGE